MPCLSTSARMAQVLAARLSAAFAKGCLQCSAGGECMPVSPDWGPCSQNQSMLWDMWGRHAYIPALYHEIPPAAAAMRSTAAPPKASAVLLGRPPSFRVPFDASAPFSGALSDAPAPCCTLAYDSGAHF